MEVWIQMKAWSYYYSSGIAFESETTCAPDSFGPWKSRPEDINELCFHIIFVHCFRIMHWESLARLYTTIFLLEIFYWVARWEYPKVSRIWCLRSQGVMKKGSDIQIETQQFTIKLLMMTHCQINFFQAIKCPCPKLLETGSFPVSRIILVIRRPGSIFKSNSVKLHVFRPGFPICLRSLRFIRWTIIASIRRTNILSNGLWIICISARARDGSRQLWVHLRNYRIRKSLWFLWLARRRYRMWRWSHCRNFGLFVGERSNVA